MFALFPIMFPHILIVRLSNQGVSVAPRFPANVVLFCSSLTLALSPPHIFSCLFVLAQSQVNKDVASSGIPPLGPHFSIEWDKEDQERAQRSKLLGKKLRKKDDDLPKKVWLGKRECFIAKKKRREEKRIEGKGVDDQKLIVYCRAALRYGFCNRSLCFFPYFSLCLVSWPSLSLSAFSSHSRAAP